MASRVARLIVGALAVGMSLTACGAGEAQEVSSQPQASAPPASPSAPEPSAAAPVAEPTPVLLDAPFRWAGTNLAEGDDPGPGLTSFYFRFMGTGFVVKDLFGEEVSCAGDGQAPWMQGVRTHPQLGGDIALYAEGPFYYVVESYCRVPTASLKQPLVKGSVLANLELEDGSVEKLTLGQGPEGDNFAKVLTVPPLVGYEEADPAGETLIGPVPDAERVLTISNIKVATQPGCKTGCEFEVSYTLTNPDTKAHRFGQELMDAQNTYILHSGGYTSYTVGPPRGLLEGEGPPGTELAAKTSFEVKFRMLAPYAAPYNNVVLAYKASKDRPGFYYRFPKVG